MRFDGMVIAASCVCMYKLDILLLDDYVPSILSHGVLLCRGQQPFLMLT